MHLSISRNERLSFHLVELADVQSGHFHAQITCELSQILFSYHDFLVFMQYIGCVLRQRVDVLEVNESHFLSMIAHKVHSQTEMPIRAAPANNQ